MPTLVTTAQEIGPNAYTAIAMTRIIIPMITMYSLGVKTSSIFSAFTINSGAAFDVARDSVILSGFTITSVILSDVTILSAISSGSKADSSNKSEVNVSSEVNSGSELAS